MYFNFPTQQTVARATKGGGLVSVRLNDPNSYHSSTGVEELARMADKGKGGTGAVASQISNNCHDV